MARRASQKKLQRLGDVLQVALKKQKIPMAFEDQGLRKIWDQAVGVQISVQTFPEGIKRGTLHVKVTTSVWMHQLQFLKHDIMEKFNQLSGWDPVSAIRFSIGEMPVTPGRPKPSPRSPLAIPPLKPRDRQMIQDSLVSIADPELKEILERVMAKEIGRRRLLEKKRDR